MHVEPVGSGAIAFPLDAVLLQPVEQLEIVVRIGAHEFAIAEPTHRTLGPRPVREHEIGGVVDALRLLQAIAAADIEAAEAHHRAAADVEVLLHHQHRRALLARRNRRHQSAGAGADDDDVDLAVPSDRLRCPGLRRNRRDRTDHRARGEKAAPVHRRGCATVGIFFRRGFGGRFRQLSLLPVIDRRSF